MNYAMKDKSNWREGLLSHIAEIKVDNKKSIKMNKAAIDLL